MLRTVDFPESNSGIAMARVDRTALQRAGLDRYRFPAELGQLPFIRSLRLFGSRARGDHQPRSDIDLAVDAAGAAAGDWERVLEVLDEADTLLTIDCVRLDTLSENEPLRVAIERDGIELLRRERE